MMAAPDQPRKQWRRATVMLPSGHVIMCDGDGTVGIFFEEKCFGVGLTAVSKYPRCNWTVSPSNIF